MIPFFQNIFILIKNKFLSFIVPAILFLIFIISYASFSKNISISYWDEMLWVGRSFHFQFFINRDFVNPLWQSSTSYDQPKLAEFIYGAWLYPEYLIEKNRINEKGFDYTKFLMTKNLYMIDHFAQPYREYNKKINNSTVKFQETDHGPPSYYEKAYGRNALKTIELIYHARIINFLLLSLSVVSIYFLVSLFLNKRIALLVALLYGFNPLLIETGIVATSEALFISLFNGALLFLSLYFIKKRQIVYLLLFSFLSGLCISTKLNGTMLLIIFIVINTLFILFETKKKLSRIIFHLLLPTIISLCIFIILNPFVYKHPKGNISFMYHARMEGAKHQASEFPKSSLPSPISRVNKIYNNFFYYKDFEKFNGIYKIPLSSTFAPILFILFLTGIFCQIIRILKGEKKNILLATYFGIILISMSNYLWLDWSRYYIQLVLFVVLYETVGIVCFIKIIRKLFTKTVYSKIKLWNTSVRIIIGRIVNRLLKNRFIRIILIAGFIIGGIVIYQNWPDGTCKDCNIILISVDTLRADHMGTYGYKKNTTPNIDKWAKDASVFTNTYTIFPETHQSFYTLFTGKDDFLRNDLNTQEDISNNPQNQNKNTLAEILKNKGYQTAAFITNPVLGNIFSTFFQRGFDKYNYINVSKSTENDDSFQNDYQNGEEVTKESVAWLQKNDRKKFFLWLHYTTPHMPYNPPLKSLCKIDKNCHDPEYEQLLKESSPYSKVLKSCTQEETSADVVQKSINLYDAEILSVDEQIKKVLDSIQKNGLNKKTIVVFYGDHGEGFDHRIYGHSTALYNSSLRIPLIIKLPQKTKDHRYFQYIENFEILPIILGSLKINYPFYFDKKIEQQKQNTYLFAKTSKKSDKLTVFDKNYKYILSNTPFCLFNDLTEELYNIKNDPEELENLAIKYPGIARRLKGVLIKQIRTQPLKDDQTEKMKQNIEKLKSLGY